MAPITTRPPLPSTPCRELPCQRQKQQSRDDFVDGAGVFEWRYELSRSVTEHTSMIAPGVSGVQMRGIGWLLDLWAYQDSVTGDSGLVIYVQREQEDAFRLTQYWNLVGRTLFNFPGYRVAGSVCVVQWFSADIAANAHADLAISWRSS